MFGIRPFLCGLLAGACGGLFVTNFHVVHTAEGVFVVPRTQRPPLRSSYVDIRSWSEAMWANHPEVTEALVADGRSSLIGDNLKDNLLDELRPKQTQNESAPRSRSTARRSETKPVGRSNVLANKPGTTREATPGIEAKSSVRQRWESALDQAVSPIVDDDPADLASDQTSNVLPPNAEQDEIVRQLEDRLVPTTPSSIPSARPSQVEAIPASGDASQMARDLLKQVIPPGGSFPGSAAPPRDFGQSMLNAPAPGQGAAAQSLPQVPVQSQLIQSVPF